MLIGAMIPLAAWKWGPAWLHPYLIVFGIIVVIVIAILVVRYIQTDRAEQRLLPSRSEYLWLDGWDILRYHRALLTFLKVEDWRVRSAEAIDPDRLLVAIQRDRHRLPLLLLRPGLAPTEADLDQLHTIQKQDFSWEAALITDAATRPEPRIDDSGARLIVLGYDSLPTLADALDGGSEEDRRAAAAAAKEASKAGGFASSTPTGVP